MKEVFRAASPPYDQFVVFLVRVKAAWLHDFRLGIFFLETIERVSKYRVILKQASCCLFATET